VVARPFDKFFNWNEGGRSTGASLRTVTEKLDGVLGVLYRDSTGYSIASRGALDSPHAHWATSFLRHDYDLEGLPEEWTLLFEIINPNLRLVVDYGDTSALTLLAIRNRFTGEHLPFQVLQNVSERISEHPDLPAIHPHVFVIGPAAAIALQKAVIAAVFTVERMFHPPRDDVVEERCPVLFAQLGGAIGWDVVGG